MTGETPPGEPTYAAAQREVQRKLGRCLIRLQHYELLLKAMIARRTLAGSIDTLKNSVAANVSRTSTQMLGKLVGDFMKEYMKPLGAKSAEAPMSPNFAESNEPWISLELSVAIPPDRHAAMSEQLAELVTMRNRLVHHFIESFDLRSDAGCLKADLYLNECFEKINHHFAELQHLAVVSDKVRADMADLLISDPEFLGPELSEGGTGKTET